MSKESIISDQFLDLAKEYIKHDNNITAAAKYCCHKLALEYDDNYRRQLSSKLEKKKITKNKVVIEQTEDFILAKKRKLDKRRKTFIISWAQNGTPIHDNFFNNLVAYSDHLKAGLHIIAGRYKNPTSVFTDKDKDSWADEVLPYLDANRHHVHEHLEILSDIKISPTASTPLSGLNGISGLESCIIGHPRMHLKSLPVLDGYPNKLLVSTGACTVENYTDSKAGKKAKFHHNLGAVIVELDGDHFHIRQITADDEGNFYDLFHRVKKGKVKDNLKGCEAAILGDIHVRKQDRKAVNVSFKLLDRMKPNHTIIHDILEGESVSHHARKNPFEMLRIEENDLGNLEQELDEMVEWVSDRLKYNLVFTRGNHEDFLDRWLQNTDWRKDTNKKAYLKYSNIVADGLAPKGVVPYILDMTFGDRIKTLGRNDSYRVKEFELALHGDYGAGGSRGGPTQFKNMNTKNVTAHSHSPHREDGHFRVGTLTMLRLGYNQGLSSWMHTNVLIYPDGKAQHVHKVNGKFHR